MSIQCPACGAQNTASAQFCNRCGGTLQGVCRHCGHVNAPSARFCSGCGQPVQPTGPRAKPAPAQTAPAPILLSPASSGPLAAHSVIAGRYEVARMLGEGGMGAVYLVTDQRTSSKRALKEMTDQKLTDPAERQRALDGFRQEAEMLANLDHPNLPKVMDFFSDQGNQYLVMEFVEGETLEKRLQNAGGRPLPEPDVRKIVHQLVDVLDYLHSHTPPIIFRDLKPANIMVQPDGRLKLIDFGIARHFKPGKSKDTQAMGTPGYAAPEQYGKGQSDARTDIYALGALTHHMLSGRDPSGDPFHFPPLRQFNPNVSGSIETVVTRAVAQQRDQRWPSVKEIRAALTGGLTQASLSPATPGAALPPTTVMPPVIPPVTPSFTPGTPSIPGMTPGMMVPAPLPGVQPQLSPRMATASSMNTGMNSAANISSAPQLPVLQWPDANPDPGLASFHPASAPQIPLLGQTPASIGRRFFALLIDSIVIYVAFGLCLSWIVDMGIYEIWANQWILWLALIWVFLIWPVASRGRTLGKTMCGVKIVLADGSAPGYWRAFVRQVIGVPLSSLLFGLGYLIALSDANKQALHDKIAGTYVVQV